MSAIPPVVTPAAANPASAFYAGSRAAQALGATLRGVDALSPAWGTRAALRLFFTPLPWKLTMRRPAVAPWSMSAWPFEGVTLASYRRADVEAGRPRVLLDFPGHGRSGGWRSTLPQFTRAIHSATSRFGPWHGVVAHSLGAVAALHTAARGLPAKRLVLVAPSAPPALFL
ncbi:MAG: lysophospholipase, partial [Betaproteobacteria bacterium]